MFRYVSPALMPVRSAAVAPAVVPPLLLMNVGFHDDAKVRSNVLPYAPLVTPRGNPANVGTCVATAPFDPGAAQQWM